MTDESFTFEAGGWLEPHFSIVRNDTRQPERVISPRLAYYSFECDEADDSDS